jgi:hypothetical protein
MFSKHGIPFIFPINIFKNYDIRVGKNCYFKKRAGQGLVACPNLTTSQKVHRF